MTTLKVLCVFGVPHLVVLRHLVSSDASCEMRKKIIDPSSVVRINLNHGDIARYLSKEPSLLTELVLLHINTNRFCGTVPHKFDKLKLLFELDLSNNCFVEKFLDVVLCLLQLKFLDLRFNKFKGSKWALQQGLGHDFHQWQSLRLRLIVKFKNSLVSMIVLANNRFHGWESAGIGNMKRLNEIILMNNAFRSCFLAEIGLLQNLIVFNESF